MDFVNGTYMPVIAFHFTCTVFLLNLLCLSYVPNSLNLKILNFIKQKGIYYTLNVRLCREGNIKN